jgi:hypothetical protein
MTPVSASAASFATITDDCGVGCTTISITGTIEWPDELKLDRLIKNQKIDKALVKLDSPGGTLDPMMSMGYEIREAGFWTYVPPGAVCASACATLWLAGKRRFLAPDGHLGFHSAGMKINGRIVPSPRGDTTIQGYLRKLIGLRQDAIDYFFSAGPGMDISFVSVRKLHQLGIDCDEYPPPMLADPPSPKTKTITYQTPPPSNSPPVTVPKTSTDPLTVANAVIIGVAFFGLVIIFTVMLAGRWSEVFPVPYADGERAHSLGIKAVNDTLQPQEVDRKAVEEAIGHIDVEEVAQQTKKETPQQTKSPWAKSH